MEESIKGKKVGTIKNCWNKIIKPELLQILLGLKKVIIEFVKSPKSIFNKGWLNFDIAYLCVVIALVVYGLIVFSSASEKVLKQAVYALVGILVMIFISKIKVSVIKEISPFLMFIATILLFAVFFRADYNGTHRRVWGIQPSELGKVTLIMWLGYLMDKYKKSKDKTSSFFVFLGITAIYGVLVLLESHLSGCILYLCIGYAMMWYADMDKKWFVVVTAGVFAIFLLVVWKPESILGLKDYQAERIVIWKKILFNGELTSNEKLNKARQVLQSLYGIGSGGLFGVGYGNSGQKISNLQEEANDFIFAVLGEELGFFGAILMFAAYGVLVYLGFKIAFKTKTTYGRLVALGISTQMALQVLINVAVATSLLPNTGISLPFFSSGGSSMVVNLASMGIMLSISKDSRQVKKDA